MLCIPFSLDSLAYFSLYFPFNRGLPKDLIPILHDFGIKVIVVSPTVDGAKGGKAIRARCYRSRRGRTRRCAGYKITILDSDETGVGLVNMGRFQIRALRTSLVERLIQREESTGTSFTWQVMEPAWIKGNLTTGVLPAGQFAGLISDTTSVREVINEIIS